MGEEVLGRAAKVDINKENCTIVGDGSTQDAVEARVRQIKNVLQNTEQDYEREKLNERVARLSGGVAILQVRAATCGHPAWKSLSEAAGGRLQSCLKDTRSARRHAWGGRLPGSLAILHPHSPLAARLTAAVRRWARRQRQS